MTSQSIAILVLIFSFSFFSEARDLGFRYKDGKCVNAMGVEGLNSGFIGQCSDLRGVVMSRFVLDDMDLQGSQMENADLQGTSLKRTNLSHTQCAMGNFSGVNFEGAILHDVNFAGAQMANVHLSDADILNLDLSGADLSGSQLSYLKCPGCKMAQVKMAGVVMDHADLSGMNLSSVDFSRANLQESMLDGANLTNATMSDVNLVGASLVGVKAANVNLRRATLRQANLKGSDLQNSILNSVPMDSANLEKVSFKNADLRRANFTKTNVKGADFTGAKFNRHTVLPFSKDQALKYGMIEGGGGVLILWDTTVDDPEVVAIQKFLVSQGQDVALSTQGHNQFDGTEKLSDYDSLLHLFSNAYGFELSSKAQTTLVKFVQSGGTYIATAWSGFAVSDNQYFQGMRDMIFLGYLDVVSGDQLVTAPQGKEKHPLLTGLTLPLTISAQFSLAKSFLPPISKIADPETILEDANQNKVAGVRKIGLGNAVNFAFVPEATFNPLEQETVQRLVLNAVEL